MTASTRFNPGDRVHVVSRDYPRCQTCNAAKALNKEGGKWISRETKIIAAQIYARENLLELSYFSDREGSIDTHNESETFRTSEEAAAECQRRNAELPK